MQAVITLIFAVFTSPSATENPDFLKPNDEKCAFSQLSRQLSGKEQWHDLSTAIVKDPSLASELADLMPDYRLAYVHRDTRGVLLVGGRVIDADGDKERLQRDHWQDTVRKTHKACDDSGVSCDVAAFPDAPFGLKASTTIRQDDDVIRRETIAFFGADQCSYSVQFMGVEDSLTPHGWREIQLGLLSIRRFVHQTFAK